MTIKLPAEEYISPFHAQLWRMIREFLSRGGDMNDVAPALQRVLDDLDEEMAE